MANGKPILSQFSLVKYIYISKYQLMNALSIAHIIPLVNGMYVTVGGVVAVIIR